MKNDSEEALTLALLRLRRAVERVLSQKKEAENHGREVESAAQKVLEQLDDLIAQVEEKA